MGVERISGELRFGETFSASWAISRAYGVGAASLIFYFAILIIVMFGLIGSAEAFLPPSFVDALLVPAILVVGVGGMVGIFWMRQGQVGRALKARGRSLITPITYTVDDGALVMDSPDGTMRFAWVAITDLIPTKAHWVFITGGMGYCLPRRFFASVADERAFVRVALAQMSDDARWRSRKAATFVAWE